MIGVAGRAETLSGSPARLRMWLSSDFLSMAIPQNSIKPNLSIRF
jgi:hypothetical protein